MNGDHEKPSTSSGSDDTQESPNGSSETNQAEGANGVPGDHEDGNSSNPSPPEENFTKVGKWLTSIEDDVLFYSSEFKSTVVQWLTERLRSTETQSTEAKPEPPQSPTTREERPRAIYWWQRGAHGSPAESGSSSSDEQRKTAPLYWWQRPKGLRSPSSAHSSSSPDKSDADVSMVAELEKLNMYDKPNRLEHSEVPNRMNKNMWSSFESDIIEIPQSLLLKCKPPQPRRHSENWDDEEEVPVFFFVKRRRSSGRVSRKSVLTYDRKSRSFEELCLSFDSSPSTEPLSEQLQRTAQGESPSMHRSFVSEDDLLHRIASRGYRIYYRWLCVWYRIRREYKHVSAGIRKLNKENR